MPERYNSRLLSGSFEWCGHMTPPGEIQVAIRPRSARDQVRPRQYLGKCPHSSVNPWPRRPLCRGMSLTGTSFLYTLIALAVVAVVLPLVLWSRLRGPRVARAAARVLMLLFAQGT